MVRFLRGVFLALLPKTEQHKEKGLLQSFFNNKNITPLFILGAAGISLIKIFAYHYKEIRRLYLGGNVLLCYLLIRSLLLYRLRGLTPAEVLKAQK